LPINTHLPSKNRFRGQQAIEKAIEKAFKAQAATN
jgi:hypothetical protein